MRILADARSIPLKDGCVQCVVTSPPYFGLRDYGTDSQIGLEASPLEYVASLVCVFAEVWRVLSDDGIAWLNLGDSYAGLWGAQSRPQGATGEMADRSVIHARQIASHPRFAGLTGTRGREMGLKPKDLMGIPWRVAFALQEAGWYLRSDVIWSKPNPMPESIEDRPTKSHEYVFLLTKSDRYYYDKRAICEPYHPDTLKRGKSIRQVSADGQTTYRFNGEPLEPESVERGRNARSVWMIATKAYRGAHFATMPEKLAERCILAGSRPGDLVLDPFGGSGTTVRVARRFNRRGVMLDLNPAYLELARERISNLQPSVLEVSA